LIHSPSLDNTGINTPSTKNHLLAQSTLIVAKLTAQTSCRKASYNITLSGQKK